MMITKTNKKKLLIKQFVIFLFTAFLFFCYIYRVSINGLFFSTTTFLALLRCFLFINKTIKNKDMFIFSDTIVFLSACLLPIGASLLASLINGENDFSILKYILSIPYYLLAFYCIKLYRSKINKNMVFNDIAIMYIITGVFQCIISLIGFFIPEVGQFLVRIQDLGGETDRILHFYNFRLIGLGTKFWGAGIVFSLDLLLIAQLLSDKTAKNEKYYHFLPFFYFIIFVVGMMMSRTTIIGLLFSVVILFRYFTNQLFSLLKIFFPSILFFSLLICYFININSESLKTIVNFGFDIVINYVSGQGIQNKSLNKMSTMYVFPKLEEYKTWIIGDGLFSTPDRHYYKNTDIGFCRSIYYFGLSGLLSLLVTQFCVLSILINRFETKYRLFFLLLGVMFLIFNLKGFILIHIYIIPFYFIDKTFYNENYKWREICLKYQ